MDALAGGEIEAAPHDRDLLGFHADEMHLDATFGGVEDRAMDEAIEVEIGAGLAVQPGENIGVERRRDAG